MAGGLDYAHHALRVRDKCATVYGGVIDVLIWLEQLFQK